MLNDGNIDLFENAELVDDKIIIREDIRSAIVVAKEYKFDVLKSITAIDNQDNGIELIYRLYSTANDEELLLSYTTMNSETETISDIYKSAIAEENEIYDLFGIHFLNHDDLKRLYMPEGWEGYPLKKDYVQDDTRLAWNDEDNN